MDDERKATARPPTRGWPGLRAVARHNDELLRPMAAGLAVLLLLLAFIAVAEMVSDGDAQRFDLDVQEMLREPSGTRPLGPAWLPKAVAELTALGSPAVLTLITTVAVAWLLLQRAWLTAAATLTSIVGGSLMLTALKRLFGRERPEFLDIGVTAGGHSFPSGHTTMAAVVYLTIGALIASTRRKPAERGFVLGVAAMMTAMIGVSRAYLGVHWASDVLAGWTFGTAWALAFLLATLLLRRRLLASPHAPRGEIAAERSQD